MSVTVNGHEFRTLAQPLYLADGRQVMEVYANGAKVYPEYTTLKYWVTLKGSFDYSLQTTTCNEVGDRYVETTNERGYTTPLYLSASRKFTATATKTIRSAFPLKFKVRKHVVGDWYQTSGYMDDVGIIMYPYYEWFRPSGGSMTYPGTRKAVLQKSHFDMVDDTKVRDAIAAGLAVGDDYMQVEIAARWYTNYVPPMAYRFFERRHYSEGWRYMYKADLSPFAEGIGKVNGVTMRATINETIWQLRYPENSVPVDSTIEKSSSFITLAWAGDIVSLTAPPVAFNASRVDDGSVTASYDPNAWWHDDYWGSVRGKYDATQWQYSDYVPTRSDFNGSYDGFGVFDFGQLCFDEIVASNYNVQIIEADEV